jgi:hypothetical protein
VNLIKPPQFLLRSCRTPTGWCKRKLETSEVLSLYDISDTVALDLTPKLRSKVIGTKGLTPMKIILSAALAVITEVPGGGELIPERRVKMRQEDPHEAKRFGDQTGEVVKLGLTGKPLSVQEEEATKDDDAEIPYHLWNSRVTRLWDSDFLPPSIQKPAEVIRQKIALRFWKMNVRRSFFAWFSKEYHCIEKSRPVASCNGDKYVWSKKQRGQYVHSWNTMWVHRDNYQRKSLVAAADCIERAANYSWWDWEYGSRPCFWRWSAEYHNQNRDGIPLWYQGTPPRNFHSQKKEKDPEVRSSMGEKLKKVFARRYFLYGMILSLTSFFAVAKGATDIRMVYNGTSSGINSHLWAP